jgi:hypothetical protein
VTTIVAAALDLHFLTGQIRVGSVCVRILLNLTRVGFILEIRKSEKEKDRDKDVIMTILKGI